MNPRAYPYQRIGAEWMARQEAGINADDMGVGKSLQAIGAADLAGAQRVLVIVPGIARKTWEDEWAEWQTRRRDVGSVWTSKLIPDTDVLMVSYGMLSEIKVMKYLLSRRWDALVVDEAHLAKNPASWRTRAIYGNACDGQFGLVSVSRQRWPMSGTLMPNNASELYSHSRALFPDVHRGRSFTRWVDDYCVKRKGSESIIRNSPRAAELAQLLRPHVLRRLSRDVLPDLPPLRIGRVVLQPDRLPPRSSEIDETEAAVRAAFYKASNGQGPAAEAAMAAIDEIHLASLLKWTGIAKAHAIGEYLAHELNSGLDRIVVFARHREVIDILQKALPDSAAIHGGVGQTARDRIIAGFQGRVPGYVPRSLICNLEIANAALTLTASANVAFAEWSFVPKDILQAIKRCHRNGQMRRVLARLFSLAGSSDEMMSRVIERKLKQVSAFNDGVLTQAA